MKLLPHAYDVRLVGGPSGYAQISAGGLPDLRTAPPVDYGGPGDAWGPEHLLLASIQACFLFTLRPIARLSKVAFTHLELEATGTVDRQDAVTRFTQIVLRPKVTVPAGTDHDRVLRILEKSKTTCLVSASLSTAIHLEPEIRDA